MRVRPSLAILAGAIVSGAIAVAGARTSDTEFADNLQSQSNEAIAATGANNVSTRFRGSLGWPSRHPLLSGGERLDEGARDKVAKAIAAVPGVGGISWSDGTMLAEAGEVPLSPLHCQDDVNALLRARTIRFEEGSSAIDPGSRELLDEVAAALRPCLGSIISITGHTDGSGPEPGNIALSRDRANTVRQELMRRGIPADGLRARGVGSQQPVEGLQIDDPANRRIEFAVVATTPLQPTPVDTPGPR